jgi:hypothetical protein
MSWQLSKKPQVSRQNGLNIQKFAQGYSNNINSQVSSPANTSCTGDYKQLMSRTYHLVLQAMQDVKKSTLALQGNNITVSAYRNNILQAQATFTSAVAYVQANPPADEKLYESYQEFLAGISLAKEAMSVVLNGISSLSLSDFYEAREMGRSAQQQVVDAYQHF